MVRAFGAEIPDQAAISMGSGLCGGMGGKATCGALSGAVVGLGFHLSPNRKQGLAKKKVWKGSRELHEAFTNSFGSAICQDLLTLAKDKKLDKKKNCAMLTREAATKAVSMLLERRPELAAQADLEFLQTRDNKLGGVLKKFF